MLAVSICHHRMNTLLPKPLPDASQPVLAPFPDSTLISGYAKDSVAKLVQSGIIKGDSNGISPLGYTSRAEIAVVLYRLLEL